MMMLWFNGSLQPAAAPVVDPRDRGFLLGDGLFETILTRGRQPQHMDRHLQRLKEGCAVLNMSFPELDYAAAAHALIEANALLEGVLRLTVSRGVAGRGLLVDSPHPTVLMTADALSPPMSPVRLVIATSTCRNEKSPLTRVKSLNYLDSILARQEAVHRGADDALLCNTKGNIAEATTANVMVVTGSKIVTPRLNEGALPGISRARLMERLTIEEGTIRAKDLLLSDEIFLTNSLGIRSVLSVDGHNIGAGGEGPVAVRARRELN